MKYLVAIVGATAVGKTEVAIRVAQHFDTEILSADSRQFYKGMDIGTAKPNAKELAAVKHHFIDCLPPEHPYSAGQYQTDALEVLAQLFRQHDVAVLVGGSGLYVEAVCNGFDPMPTIAPSVRDELNATLASQGLPTLLAELAQKDATYFAQVDKANPQRIIRALEVIRATNLPYSTWRNKQATTRPFQTILIGLDRPRPELYARIEQRMDVMLAEGLLQEAQSLYHLRHLNALQTVGYKEIFDFMDGKTSWEQTVNLLKQNSRNYAKRQLTWFRRNPQTKWFSPDQTPEICQYIKNFTINL